MSVYQPVTRATFFFGRGTSPPSGRRSVDADESHAPGPSLRHPVGATAEAKVVLVWRAKMAMIG